MKVTLKKESDDEGLKSVNIFMVSNGITISSISTGNLWLID